MLIVLGRRGGLGAAGEATAFVAGLVAWSFAEYWIHRAVFHGQLGFEAMHEMHHALPKDLIGVASWGTFAGFAVVWLLLAGLFGSAISSAMTAGFALGYLVYCTVHVAIHHRAAQGLGRYGAMMLALHQGHHRGGRGNFGVSSPLWDIVFGTFRPQPAGFVVAIRSRIKWTAVVTLIIAAMVATVLGGLAVLGWLLVLEDRARARDLGQWEAADPAVREWYQSLMQPDVPTARCVGEEFRDVPTTKV